MKIIILTGGTSKRFGYDKSTATINGESLLSFATKNLTELIVVGPTSSVNATYIQEEPAFGGPAAAIATAMKFVDTDLVGIFAVDMPFATKLIPTLLKGLVNDAALPVDSEGIAQPLAGIYKAEPLRKALSEFHDLDGLPVKKLIGKLVIDRIQIEDSDYLIDIDTQEDLKLAIDLHSKFSS